MDGDDDLRLVGVILDLHPQAADVCVDETWAKTGTLFAKLQSADDGAVREAADEINALLRAR